MYYWYICIYKLYICIVNAKDLYKLYVPSCNAKYSNSIIFTFGDKNIAPTYNILRFSTRVTIISDILSKIHILHVTLSSHILEIPYIRMDARSKSRDLIFGYTHPTFTPNLVSPYLIVYCLIHRFYSVTIVRHI